jgi:ech hydrogenase subunit D
VQGEVTAVTAETVLGEVAKLKAEGYRLVTLTCVELDATSVDILYHFDRGLELKHLRLTAAKGVRLPSISPVFFSAFLVENEIQDLFGLRFMGLAIDYGRTLYLSQEVREAPFCRFSADEVVKEK